MPSATPKADVSLSWPDCPACDAKHRPNTPCPRRGVWLATGTAVDDPYPRLRLIRGPA